MSYIIQQSPTPQASPPKGFLGIQYGSDIIGPIVASLFVAALVWGVASIYKQYQTNRSYIEKEEAKTNIEATRSLLKEDLSDLAELLKSDLSDLEDLVLAEQAELEKITTRVSLVETQAAKVESQLEFNDKYIDLRLKSTLEDLGEEYDLNALYQLINNLNRRVEKLENRLEVLEANFNSYQLELSELTRVAVTLSKLNKTVLSLQSRLYQVVLKLTRIHRM